MPDDDFIAVGKPLPRITGFEPLEERRARISWTTGELVEVDLLPALSSWRAFLGPLSNDVLFRSGKINEFGDAISWGGGAELSATWIERLAEQQGKIQSRAEA